MTDEPAKPLSIFDICETDTEAEENGRWFTDIFGDGTNVDVKLRRLSSKVSVNARRRIALPFQRHAKRGELPDNINVKILCRQLAEAVIVDWRGVADKDGAIEYSADVADMLLTKLPNFRGQILALSMSMDAFRVEDRGDAEKN